MLNLIVVVSDPIVVETIQCWTKVYDQPTLPHH